MDVNNAGSGFGIQITQADVAAADQAALRIDSALIGGDTYALDISQTGDGHAVRIVSSATSQAVIDLDVNGSAAGGIDLDMASGNSGSGISVVTLGTGRCVNYSNNGTGGAASSIARFNYSNTTAATNAVVDINCGTATATELLLLTGSSTANYIDTDAGGGTPAHLTNGGVWTDASCFRELKRNIVPVNEAEVLNKIEKMSISRYYDKADKSENPRRRFAPFQDDLVNEFDLDSRGVSAVEVATIALAGIKALVKELRHGHK